jgi:hypothetical protein
MSRDCVNAPDVLDEPRDGELAVENNEPEIDTKRAHDAEWVDIGGEG